MTPEESLHEALGGNILQGVGDPLELPDEEQEKSAAVTLSPVSQNNIFSHYEAHPVAIDVVMLSKYGPDWFSWEPETLWTLISQDFSTSISELNKNKIMAVKTLHVVSSFWEQWEVFVPVATAFTGLVPRFDVFQLPSLPMIWATVEMADEVRKHEYGEEVGRFIATVARHDSVWYLPPPLDFAQTYVNQPHHEYLNPDPVKARYEQALRADLRFEENPIDTQVQHLLQGRGYSAFKRSQMVSQMRVL